MHKDENIKREIREYRFQGCSMKLCGWKGGTRKGETRSDILGEEFFFCKFDLCTYRTPLA